MIQGVTTQHCQEYGKFSIICQTNIQYCSPWVKFYTECDICFFLGRICYPLGAEFAYWVMVAFAYRRSKLLQSALWQSWLSGQAELLTEGAELAYLWSKVCSLLKHCLLIVRSKFSYCRSRVYWPIEQGLPAAGASRVPLSIKQNFFTAIAEFTIAGAELAYYLSSICSQLKQSLLTTRAEFTFNGAKFA